MNLFYLDESGSTGLDLDNKDQPFFILACVQVKDKNWHTYNDYFQKEKIKISPLFEYNEIHTNELFNSNSKSIFYNNYWKDNFIILEKLVNLICSMNIMISYISVCKKNYKKHFGNNIVVDPYLYSFATIYEKYSKLLNQKNEYGIIFCDELKSMEESLEILYPRLNIDSKNIIEKTFYLNSKKNNFIQIADICSFYINKYYCITSNQFTMDTFKKEHCLKMYKKLEKIMASNSEQIPLSNIDYYFK